METRTIATCQLCGKARLEIALTTDGLCNKCRRAVEAYPDLEPITEEGFMRLLDDLGVERPKDF